MINIYHYLFNNELILYKMAQSSTAKTTWLINRELYCTILYCTVLYCTVLYCIVLYLETAALLGVEPEQVVLPDILRDHLDR